MLKTNQQEFEIEKVIKRKGDKQYFEWKGYDNSFNIWIDKKILLHKNGSSFPPYSHSKNKIEIELDSSNYARKSDLKNEIGVDASQFAKKVALASLKLEA